MRHLISYIMHANSSRSQGSTKVFKQRPTSRATASLLVGTSTSTVTEQRMTANLEPNSALFLLPDPVTCFKSASYSQIQRFNLHETASLVLLDWVTSGRKTIGEDWSFTRYYSLNEVVVGDESITKDVMLLEDKPDDSIAPASTARALSQKLAPYSCYATLLLYGPLVQDLVTDIASQYQKIVVMKRKTPDTFIWSLSSLTRNAVVIRMAGKETEDVRDWLRVSMSRLQAVIGEDAYRRAFV
jgi:urease accessory protein